MLAQTLTLTQTASCHSIVVNTLCVHVINLLQIKEFSFFHYKRHLMFLRIEVRRCVLILSSNQTNTHTINVL